VHTLKIIQKRKITQEIIYVKIQYINTTQNRLTSDKFTHNNKQIHNYLKYKQTIQGHHSCQNYVST